MKPERQRIAIAEACGFTFIEKEDDFLKNVTYWKVRSPSGKIIGIWSEYGIDTEYTDRWNSKISAVCCACPDYTNDLNACEQMEEHLHGEEWAAYFDWLQKHGRATGVRATSGQRCEGFLRIKGKWDYK